MKPSLTRNDLPDMSAAYNEICRLSEKKLDPVGKEDGDVDNDGDKDSSDKYLMKRRKAISKAIKNEHHQKDADGKVIEHDDEESPGTPSSVEEAAAHITELSKKTLGSYVKKASKETRGNMMATQHGSGIPKKAKDIKLKQVSKRLKGMEKAGEKMAEETVEEGMATPESGTGKYYNEKKPTDMQKAKKAKMDKVKALTNAGKHKEASALYKSEEVINVLSPEELERVAQISKEYDENLQKEGMKYGLTKGTGKPGGAMKAYLDNKAKKLEAEKKKQKPEYANNPAFGDPSHHSNAKK